MPFDLSPRIDRLADLALGLAAESQRARDDASWPLLYVERRAYADLVLRAVAALEEARITLARAHQRLATEAPADN